MTRSQCGAVCSYPTTDGLRRAPATLRAAGLAPARCRDGAMERSAPVKDDVSWSVMVTLFTVVRQRCRGQSAPRSAWLPSCRTVLSLRPRLTQELLRGRSTGPGGGMADALA